MHLYLRHSFITTTVLLRSVFWGFFFLLSLSVSKQCLIQAAAVFMLPIISLIHHTTSACECWSSPSLLTFIQSSFWAMPYRRPQSFLRMWRILRPRLDFHGLTKLLVLTISRPVFQSSWPATTYSDPDDKGQAEHQWISSHYRVSQKYTTGKKIQWEVLCVKSEHSVV